MENNIIVRLIELADAAKKLGDSPVAAIIVYENEIISEAYNLRNITNKTIDHAEIIAINKANQKLNSWRLNKCSMYVTIKPCDMCEKVIKEARISNVYFLVDRLDQKKQYDKTIYKQLNSEFALDYQKKYSKKIKNFWKNIRKKN